MDALVATLAVIAAGAYLARRAYKAYTSSKGAGCGCGAAECPAKSPGDPASRRVNRS